MSHSFSPFFPSCVINREFVLHITVAGKVLPIRILDPECLHVFVADVEGVLEIAEAHEQSDWRARPAGLGIERLKLVLETLPIDFVSHLNQRVVLIEHLLKVCLEKMKLIFERVWLWLHFFVLKLQGFEHSSMNTLQYYTPSQQHLLLKTQV